MRPILKFIFCLDEAGIRALEFKMVYYGVWKIKVIGNSEKVLPRKCLIPSLITLVTDTYKIQNDRY